MPKMIQLRNVPDELHRKVKARAAEAGMSLSDYILKDVARLAEQPTMEEWRRKLATLPRIKLKESPEQTIRKMRDGR